MSEVFLSHIQHLQKRVREAEERLATTKRCLTECAVVDVLKGYLEADGAALAPDIMRRREDIEYVLAWLAKNGDT